MKILKLCLSISVIVLLSSCNNSDLNDNGKYIVSAIGIDKSQNDYVLSVEAVVVNSEDSERDIENLVFGGVSPTLEKAWVKAVEKSAKPLSLSHCAVVALGESIKSSDLEQIIEFCIKKEDLTVSVGFIRCFTAKEILSQKPFSSVAVGYDIASILETQYTQNKKSFNNRLYEIYETKNIDGLPLFKIAEKRVSFGGNHA